MDKKIAVPCFDKKLCAHFGHCQEFAILEVKNSEIGSVTWVTPPPHEPGVLPAWLHEQGVHVIIAGGMGSRAQQLFAANEIEVFVGAPSETPENLVSKYLSKTLESGDNLCDH